MATFLLQAALNGTRTQADSPSVPISADELVAEAVAAVTAGAGAIHMHPRDRNGVESLDPVIINTVCQRVYDAARVPVGVSTGAWIEPDLERRLELIRGWREPAYASVNLGEEGAVDVMRALIVNGIGIEAGISTAEEVELLAETGLASSCVRILVEPYAESIVMPDDMAALVAAIHAALDRQGIVLPRLQHSEDAAVWTVLEDAIQRGYDTRVGLEDTLTLPDGSPATGNADLVHAAIMIGNRVRP